MKGLTQLAVAIVVAALGSAPARTQPLTAEDAAGYMLSSDLAPVVRRAMPPRDAVL